MGIKYVGGKEKKDPRHEIPSQCPSIVNMTYQDCSSYPPLFYFCKFYPAPQISKSTNLSSVSSSAQFNIGGLSTTDGYGAGKYGSLGDGGELGEGVLGLGLSLQHMNARRRDQR